MSSVRRHPTLTYSNPTLDMHQVSSREFYCFDCDGVLWRGKDAIPEARNLLIKLKEAVNKEEEIISYQNIFVEKVRPIHNE